MKMGFGKEYFESFSDRLKQYFETFPTGMVTVTIKIGHDLELHMNKIIEADDQLLTFAYYNAKKEKALPARVRDERGDTKGFPVMAVPYHVIQWVEFNPGTVKDGKAGAGFQYHSK